MRRSVAVMSAVAGLALYACGGSGSSDGDESAGEAMKRQQVMLQEGRFGPLWEQLHPAHQKLVSKEDFMRCMVKSTIPDYEVEVQDTFEETVPLAGTDQTVDTVAVVMRWSNERGDDRVTRHVVEVDGEWLWVLADPQDFEGGACPT